MIEEICKLTLGNDFLDFTIPIIKIQLSELTCSQVDILRWIFELEKNDMGYAINGVKIFIPLILLIIWAIISYLKSGGLLNKAVRKYLRR